MKQSMICLLVALMGLSSCKKFLEERTQSEMTPVTTRDYSELLYGTAYTNGLEIFQPQTVFMDDDIQVYSNDVDHNRDAQGPLAGFSWQYDYADRMEGNNNFTEQNFNSYIRYYKKISGCNIGLDNAYSSSGTIEEKDQLAGEAYGMRAWYYFNLVNLYARPYNDSSTTPDKLKGVPLMLSSNLLQDLPARNTVKEVYDQIEKDLEASVERLGKEKKQSYYRFNYLAASLLASRVGLFMEKWDKAITNADAVIASYSELYDLNDWPANYAPDENSFLPICTNPAKEVLWLFSNYNEYQVSSTVYAVSQDLAAQFEPTDLRTLIYYNEIPPFLYFIIPVKFSSAKHSLKKGNASGAAFRTSEAYLNRAEAYAQKFIATGDAGFMQKSLDDLNTLRSKRFAPADFHPVTAMTGPELLQFCRNERRRELFTEHHRWYDLRRYGMPEIVHHFELQGGVASRYVLLKGDPQYTLQIPEAAILLNPKLEQNPRGPIRLPSN